MFVIVFLLGRMNTDRLSIPYLLVTRTGVKIPLTPSSIRNFILSQSNFLFSLSSRGWSIISYGNNKLLIQDGHGLKVFCRMEVGSDFGGLKEIFCDEVYGGYDFRDKIVVDVGMSNGDSSLFFASKGARLVIGIEPYKDSFELASQNIMINELSEVIKPINAALSSSDGVSRLSTYSLGPNSNSIHPTDFSKGFIRYDGETECRAISLKSLCDQFSIDRIDFLKLDCEGSEYEIFNNVEFSIMKKICFIRMEYHDGFKLIRQRLESFGFQVKTDGHDLRMGLMTAWQDSTQNSTACK